MALQYLEALKALGSEPVHEVRHPDRVHPLVEPLTGYIEQGHRRRGRRAG